MHWCRLAKITWCCLRTHHILMVIHLHSVLHSAMSSCVRKTRRSEITSLLVVTWSDRLVHLSGDIFHCYVFLQCTSHGVKIGWGLRINIICENARIVQFHVLVENVSIYETVAQHWLRVLYTPCGVEPVNLWCMYVSVVMRWVLALAKTSGRSNSWHKGLHCPRTWII